MFVDFFAEWESMVHTVRNLVVDVEAGTVATEQHVDLIARGDDRDAQLQLLHRERRRAVLPRDHLDGWREPTHVIRWPSRPPATVSLGQSSDSSRIRVRFVSDRTDDRSATPST